MARLWLLLAIVSTTLPVAFLVNRIVPDPYMDEIFHIPQAQLYCQGDFKRWDPMITTFPGLYYISIIFTSAIFSGFRLMGLESTLPDLCCPFFLRSVNIALAILCSFFFREIIIQIEPNISARMASVKAVVLALYPLHWFFTFLFYTDVGSTTAVMAMYLACLKKAYWTSGLLGIVAILFRQTNVVWTAFVTFVGVKNYLQDQDSDKIFVDESDVSLCSSKGQLCTSESLNLYVGATQLRRRHHAVSKQNFEFLSSQTHISSLEANSSASTEAKGLFEDILLLAMKVWHRRWGLIQRFLLLIIAISLFVVFVLYNGGIVLGAKEAHKVSPHFAQVMYFAVAASVAMAPIHFSPCWIRRLFQSAMRKRKQRLLTFIAAAFIASLTCVHFFSLAHPYLLADNRHYTFYIWRKVINAHHTTKYLLIPIYVYTWYSITTALGRREEKIWILVLVLGVAGTLVPAPLIEFRYYTIPFYFIALHTPTLQPQENLVWFFMGIEYIIVNSLTMYVFLFRPFGWANTPGLQRFIW